jgi:hypothetical protein
MQYAPPPMGPTTEVISRRKKTSLDYACIVFQIIVYLAFILLIIASIRKTKNLNDERSTAYALFVIIYIIYLVVEFYSSSCSYLIHKSSAEGIYQKMHRIFSTHPEIIFHCENYHFEYTRNYQQRGNPKNVQKRKVVTYREDYSMPYYSSRDISGLFILNCQKEVVQNKAYIQLELLEEINFADNISYMDYERVRSDFYMRNRPRDYYMNYNEKRIIPNFTEYNLVSIGNQDSGMVNICIFIVATLLTCAELYKCFLDKKCVQQRFTVRKIISTRYDLNGPENNEKYQYYMPALDLQDQQHTYESQEYNYLNNDYKPDLPTMEELERAEQYKDKIPNYEIENYNTLNGDVKVGVVRDDPSYQSNNFSDEIPPGCAEKDKQYLDQFAAKFGEEGLMKYPSFDN